MGGAGAGNWCPSSSINIKQQPQKYWKPKFMHPRPVTVRASSSNTNQSSPMVQKKKMKPRLITISSSDGRWHGKWNSDYRFSLQDLQLHHLSHKADDTTVFINLSIQKHAGLGLSVEGRIATCFMTKCCNCCSPYLREINTTFKVWILQSTRKPRDSSHQLPDIGGDDPSVIYVKPGYEADLDSLIQDSIRLATSVEETCSESCAKSEPKLHHLGARNTASVEKRWYKLLELKKKHEFRETYNDILCKTENIVKVKFVEGFSCKSVKDLHLAHWIGVNQLKVEIESQVMVHAVKVPRLGLSYFERVVNDIIHVAETFEKISFA